MKPIFIIYINYQEVSDYSLMTSDQIFQLYHGVYPGQYNNH